MPAARGPARRTGRIRHSRRIRLALAGLAVLLAGLASGWVTAAAVGPGGPLLGPDEVPQEYRGLVRQAAARCPAVPLAVFAAQLAQESGWDPQAVSPAGAQGIAQFLPSTWEQYGRDGDGDGVADVWNPADAIPAMAELNCLNRDLVRTVPGDRLANVLAAYNAGHAAVRRYAGVPPFPETEAYVSRILQRARSIRV